MGSGIHNNDPKLTRRQRGYKHAENNLERKNQSMSTLL